MTMTSQFGLLEALEHFTRLSLSLSRCIYIILYNYIYIPVVPHKAVAEVSKIGNL